MQAALQRVIAPAQPGRVAQSQQRATVVSSAAAPRAAQAKRSARRSFLFGLAGVAGLTGGGVAMANPLGMNDCDPICNLGIEKASNDEYASMMAALAARKKAAAQKSPPKEEKPAESK